MSTGGSEHEMGSRPRTFITGTFRPVKEASGKPKSRQKSTSVVVEERSRAGKGERKKGFDDTGGGEKKKTSTGEPEHSLLERRELER